MRRHLPDARDRVDSLTRRVRFNRAEWRITLAILIYPGAVSARCVATHLQLDYGRVKRVLRGLVACELPDLGCRFGAAGGFVNSGRHGSGSSPDS